jgi:hypothetical protein
MSDKEAYQCERYVKRHKADLYRLDQYLIDLPALMRPFHLDCNQCHKAHRETCCENGQPYAVAQWQPSILDDAANEIVARYFPQQSKQTVERYGIWDTGNSQGSLQSLHGNCLFFKEINGRSCCAIHAYAEDENQDVYQLKPFSCQLYPLELIEVGESVLITALTEETAVFSRWGFDYLEQFYCASQPRRKLATHLDESLFSVDGYRPAYKWSEFVIRRAFGESVAEKIRTLARELDSNQKDRIPG